MVHLRRHLIPRSRYNSRNKDLRLRERPHRRFILLLNATVVGGFNFLDKLPPEENVLRSFVVTK